MEISSLESVKIIEAGFRCIWDINKGFCSYNPYTPPIYFSLGDALTAVALLFAVIQLISPIRKITLAIKGFKDRLLWIFIGVALLSNLLATNIPQLQNLNLPHPLNYALFWEQLSFILFIFAVIWFWFQASLYKNIFNEKNAERFFRVILREIADKKKDYIEASITILYGNLEKIVSVINSNSSGDYFKYAISLLNYVLSEKTVLQYITTNRMDFLFRLIVLIKENNIPDKKIGFVVSKLVKELYNNRDSYLYKQMDDHSGVSMYASLYNEIFREDKDFILEFNILREWHPYNVSEELLLDQSYIEVYLKSLSKVIELDCFSDSRICDMLSNSLYELETYVQRANWTNADKSRWYGSSVGNFLGRTFPDAYKKAVENKQMNKQEFEYIEGSRKYGQNISGAYATAIIDYLRILARFNDKSMERTYALDVTDPVLSPLHENDVVFNNIRSYFFEFAWEYIEDNVIRGHFPPFLRVYIEIMLWISPNSPEWRKQERKKLVDYLNNELGPRLKKNELMADFETPKSEELLPENIVYENNKFWTISRDGSRTELKS